MKLYHEPLSRSVRALVALEELGVPYEVERVSLRRGDHRTPAHLALHPLGQLPVLEDGDLRHFIAYLVAL